MKQINLMNLALIALFSGFLFHGAEVRAEAAEDAAAGTTQKYVPVNSGKDPESKTIHFNMANSENPEESVRIEYHADPSQMNDIAKLRKELLIKQAEVSKRVSFLRLQMNLPADMPDENVMALFNFSSKAAQDELERQYQLKNQSTKTIFKNSIKQTFGVSQHGFLSQTILFGVAQGAVMYESCLREYAYNPSCMEQLMHGMTDPIGQIAFSSFIAANGFTTSLLNKKYSGVADPIHKVWWDRRPNPSAMRMAIPYLGMSAGMLTSNLSAELLNLMMTCGKSLMTPKNPLQAQALAASNDTHAVGSEQEADPCNEAQKEFFNFNNKVEQYIPMLLSMASSTWLLVKAGKGIQKAKMLTSAASASKFGKKALENIAVKTASKVSKPALKLVGLLLFARVTPAGWVLNGMTVISVATTILQNAGFIAMDHLLMPALNAGWGQIWRAYFVDSADEKLEELILKNQKNGWGRQASAHKPTGTSHSDTEDIVSVLNNLSVQMEAWRMINHSKIFMGLQSWVEITNNLIREMNASETFYQFYVDKVFESFKYSQKSKTPEGLVGDEIRKATYLPFRSYPLYGVKPTGHAECGEGIDEDACVSILELYMNFPADMEKFQLRTVREVVARFEETVLSKLKPGQIKPQTETELKKILTELKTNDPGKVGQALYKMNLIIMTNSLNDQNAVVMLGLLRQALGDPRPVWEQGVMLPGFFESSMAGTQIYNGMEDKSKLGYKFSNYIEYLLYQMMCGPEAKQTASVFKETFGFKPTFNPPKIISATNLEVEWPQGFIAKQARFGITVQSRVFLCAPATSVPFNLLYSSRVFEQGQKDGVPFMEFLGSHVNAKIVGNWNDLSHDSTSGFFPWWNENLKKVLASFFQRMDTEFQPLLVSLAEALNSEKLGDGLFNGFMKKHFGFKTEVDPAGLLKLTKAGRGLLKSHTQEINVYLTVLGEIENQLDPKTYSARKASFYKDMSLLEQMTMPVYARAPSQKDLVAQLSTLSNAVRGLKIVNKKTILPISMQDFNRVYDDMINLLKNYQDHLNSLPLNPDQKKIANTAYDQLSKSALSLGVYVFNTQLTNFSASQDYTTFLQNSNRVMESMRNKAKIKQHSSAYGQ